jgi:GNAT superfamily N-acetyltransferase
MSEKPEVRVRSPRRDDVASLVRIHREFGTYYTALAPDDFQVPDEDGLAEYIASELDGGEDTLAFVAEADGEVVGVLWARVERPHPDARHQVIPIVGETRLHIDYVATTEDHRRRGVGARLVAAAEEWGRERGASVALTDTYADSPLSVPFWQERMGFRTRSLHLVKPLT